LGGAPLSDAEIAVIRSWIDQGARATPTSAAAKAKWGGSARGSSGPQSRTLSAKIGQHRVDRFVAAYLAKHGIAEPPPVPDALFAKRAAISTSGVCFPHRMSLRSFINDRKANKREVQVEQTSR